MTLIKLSNSHCHQDLKIQKDILDMKKLHSENEIYNRFVERFLTYIPIDYRKKNILDRFTDQVDDIFEFLSFNDKKQDYKISINTNHKDEEIVTIFINLDNKPFIIDSLNALFDKLSLEVSFIFHPIMYVQRDDEGKVKDIRDSNWVQSNIHDKEIAKDYVAECLIFTEFKLHIDCKISKLKTKITDLLKLVIETSKFWQAILNNTSDIINQMSIAGSKISKQNLKNSILKRV